MLKIVENLVAVGAPPRTTLGDLAALPRLPITGGEGAFCRTDGSPRWGRGDFFSEYSVVISTPVQCFIQNSKNWGMKTAGEAAE